MIGAVILWRIAETETWMYTKYMDRLSEASYSTPFSITSLFIICSVVVFEYKVLYHTVMSLYGIEQE